MEQLGLCAFIKCLKMNTVACRVLERNKYAGLGRKIRLRVLQISLRLITSFLRCQWIIVSLYVRLW